MKFIFPALVSLILMLVTAAVPAKTEPWNEPSGNYTSHRLASGEIKPKPFHPKKSNEHLLEKKSPRYKCPECDTPHGGSKGRLCPECYQKNKGVPWKPFPPYREE